jgi:AraC family transcriptional regulator
VSYHSLVQEILEYIDEHIGENLNAGMLAARAGFSEYHFCRVFRWCVGYSLMEYVRNRRLAFAASELSSGRKIIDIAMEYGFDTHSGFSKAFKRRFGSAPETFRRHAHYKTPAGISLDRMINYKIGGIVMEPVFKTLPSIKLAGFALRTISDKDENSKAIPGFWTAYKTDGRMERLHGESFVKRHTEYGACFPEDPDTGEFEYAIAVEIKDGAVIPDGYYSCELPPATYAVFSTPPSDDAGFSPSIQGVWQYIFNEWFPASGYEYAPGCVDYELYDERCLTENNKVCDIYVPVVKTK